MQSSSQHVNSAQTKTYVINHWNTIPICENNVIHWKQHLFPRILTHVFTHVLRIFSSCTNLFTYVLRICSHTCRLQQTKIGILNLIYPCIEGSFLYSYSYACSRFYYQSMLSGLFFMIILSKTRNSVIRFLSTKYIWLVPQFALFFNCFPQHIVVSRLNSHP